MGIFLVEDSPLIVQRLIEMLGALPGVVLLGHAAGAKQAIEEIVARKPQLVLLDLELEQGTGLDVLVALRERAPTVDAYMLTNFVSEPLRVVAAKLGAKGFYDKTKDFQKVRALVAERAAANKGEARR
jgi:DNA-binding NarL/FixJ family response regulator